MGWLIVASGDESDARQGGEDESSGGVAWLEVVGVEADDAVSGRTCGVFRVR